MDTYVDGFLIPVATDRIDDYKAIASLAGQVWKDHGALAYCECIGDDLGIPGMVSFNHAAATAPGETVAAGAGVRPLPGGATAPTVPAYPGPASPRSAARARRQ